MNQYVYIKFTPMLNTLNTYTLSSQGPCKFSNHRSHQLSRKSYSFLEVSAIFVVFLHRASGHCSLHLFFNLCLPYLLPLATSCSLLLSLSHVSDPQLSGLSEDPCAWPCSTLLTLRSWINLSPLPSTP